MRSLRIFSVILLAVATSFYGFAQDKHADKRFITYTANAAKQNIQLYWKDDQGHILGSIDHLKNWLQQKHQRLVFAMNGGMYQQDRSPQGLFIQKGKELHHVNAVDSGYGNFYMQPNGIFYITTGHKAGVCTTKSFAGKKNVAYATQSGPMLVIHGAINPLFKQGSANLNVRNGVGILPGNKVVFVMSRTEVNFYDFAAYFKSLGCENALYLDGFVSRTYLPEQNWQQTDGSFGVLIGVTAAAQ